MKNKAVFSRLLLMFLSGLTFECLGKTTSDLPVCEYVDDRENPPIKIGDFSKPIRQIKFKQNGSGGRSDCIILENRQSGQKFYLEERGSDFPFMIADGPNKQKIGNFHWSSIINNTTGGPCIEINSDVQCQVRQLRWDRGIQAPAIHMRCALQNKKVYDFLITRAAQYSVLHGEISYPEDVIADHSRGVPLRVTKRVHEFCLSERSEDEAWCDRESSKGHAGTLS